MTFYLIVLIRFLMNKITTQISQRHGKFEGNITITLFSCSFGNAAELVTDSEMRNIVKRKINIIASNCTTAKSFNGLLHMFQILDPLRKNIDQLRL
jgi:hypothetical protein